MALRKTENLPELINLTFSSQQATVITNFANLKDVGKDHVMTRNGGMMSMSEAETTDFEKVARELIGSGKGVVTPYGVVYDNDMKMDRLYTKGSPFPSYYYEPSTLVVEMTSARKPYRPDNEADKTWLFLPMSTKQLEHAMMRAGLVSFDDKYSNCNYGKGFRTDFEKASYYRFNGTTVQMLDSRAKDGSVLCEFEVYAPEQRIDQSQNSKYKLRPATEKEAGLFYALPPEQDEALGCIGHVRIDFGKNGKEWHTHGILVVRKS